MYILIHEHQDEVSALTVVDNLDDAIRLANEIVDLDPYFNITIREVAPHLTAQEVVDMPLADESWEVSTWFREIGPPGRQVYHYGG